MAVRPATTTAAGSTTRRTWLTALALVALFAAALFLRAYWNLDAARDENGNFVLSGGSDPYYHKRAVDAIQQDHDGDGRIFETLFYDPLLNYPYGAVNPNPPIYEWSVAVAGKLMEPFFAAEGGYTALEVSTWWAMEWSPAVYGALTVFPIFFLGAALFDRRAGLVAALLWTLSTSAIDASGLGLADHDAAIMFFMTLALLFYVQALRQFRGDGNWVVNWRDGSAVASGLGRFLSDRRLGLGYAALAGVAIGAVGLVWKGFPYVIGIMFVYAVLQMAVDHWRSRDSTGLFLGTFLAMLLGVLLTVPYYSAAGVANFLTPVWYMVGAFLVAGLVLVPTRDLPSILVMPAAAVAAVLGLVVAFFVVPQVATSLLYSAIYFKRTSIYETIAEAHPADFSTIVFGVGPLPFFMALAGWFILAFNVRKHPGRPILFALVWGFIALYFANTAVRFLFNAIPAFCVFAGFMTSWLIDRLDFAGVRKSLAANRGNFWQGFRKGVRPMHYISVILVVLLFALPNGILAADAALPPQTEFEMRQNGGFLGGFAEKRLGAYGQGFIPDYWVESLTWLDAHDAGVPPEERGAFLSWWDYGHWAIAVGKHPAVADNFQNGYELAARFLLSQNETHAIQLMAARIVDAPGADARAALTEAGSADPAGDLEKLRRFDFVDGLTKAQSVRLLSILEEQTDKRIRYFATDERMLPYDDPQTPTRIDSRSIFHAPVKLAGHGDDDFVATRIHANGRTVSVSDYEQMLRDPIRPPQASGESLAYDETFFNTMYYRAHVGAPVNVQTYPTDGSALTNALNSANPGHGLEHFRVVYAGRPTAVGQSAATYSVVILEYFPGALVEGVVTEGGAPVAGATVTALDDASGILLQHFTEEFRAGFAQDFNVPHGGAVTGPDGRYRLNAPFSMGGNVTLVVSRDGAEVGRAELAISREDAHKGTRFTADVILQKGSVAGAAYEDVDNDGAFNATTDRPLANARLLVGGREAMTDENGNYTVSDVSTGLQNVTVDDSGLEVSPGSSRVRVQPGQTTPHQVLVRAKPALVDGVVFADLNDNGVQDDGEALEAARVTFTPADGGRAVEPVSRPGGNLTATLAAGSYTVTATHTADEVTYTLNETLSVSAGEQLTRNWRLVKPASG